MSNKLKAIIVEDDISIQVVIETLLSQYAPGVGVVSTARSVVDAVSVIRHYDPDVVFLDVEIIGGSGFDVLDKTSDMDYNIIFVTAFDSYAIEALRADALDYIVKPIIKLDFANAVNRFLSRQSSIKSSSTGKSIIVRGVNRDTKIDLNDILYIYLEKGSCQFKLKDGSIIHSTDTMSKFDLDEYLFQVHRNYIVNIGSIVEIDPGRGGFVRLVDGSQIAIAYRRKAELKELWKSYYK